MNAKKSWVPAAAVPVALLAAGATYWFCCRPRHLKWGALQTEVDAELPGDDLVPGAEHSATHGITIETGPEAIWPWLAQLGQQHGGFYSYTCLENLLGCHMRNAKHLVPGWQHLREGDPVVLHPKAPPMLAAIVQPDHALVLVDQLETPVVTWGFYLYPVSANASRLVARVRWRDKGTVSGRLGDYLFWEPAHFVMERKMLLTVKHLAESSVSTRTPAAAALLQATSE